MSMISLDPQGRTPLVQQLVQGMVQLIEQGTLRPGTRLPSIRSFAKAHAVSRFTVVQAYDRLVAAGHVSSRRGSGFYVQAAEPQSMSEPSTPPVLAQSVDTLWVLKRYVQDEPKHWQLGCGWLPADWMDAERLRRAMRQVAKSAGASLTQYGRGQGYEPLRVLLQQRLAERGIHAHCGQILTTYGVSHALDLVARYWLRRGDIVLVDDPAYFNLYGCLQAVGAKLIGVPRNADGPDIECLQQLLSQHSVRLMVTSSVLQNPTGSCLSPAVAYQLLKLAEAHDFMLVDDDIYGDFHPGPHTHLAALDQLRRVIHVGSFSKTVSGSVRVGYIACEQALSQELLHLKLLTSFTCSELNERLVYELLREGHYRKHLSRLHRRLEQARVQTLGELEHLNIRALNASSHGFFLWAQLPERAGRPMDAAALARRALARDLLLAPGSIFSLSDTASAWMRFNVAYAQQAGVWQVLRELLVESSTG